MKDKEQLIISISSLEDISILEEKKSIKYINIDITNPDKKIIDYLLTNGRKWSITEKIEQTIGYIYIDYAIFKKGQLLINEIMKNISPDWDDLEKSRYLYIKLGSFIGYDINTIEEKNEVLNLSTIHTINSIWGCMANGKGTNHSITKLFYYVCRLAGLTCKIAIVNNHGYQKNIITTERGKMIVDLTHDIPYIQSGFQTRFFGNYNSDMSLDEKIGYLKEKYNEKTIEQAIKEIDFTKEDIAYQILVKTQNIIHVSNMQPIELGIIYNEIFNQYCPTQDIAINNLYISTSNQKEHFILITHNNKHYSFNYSRNSFVEMKQEQLTKYIEEKKIGIYDDEKIPSLNFNKLKIA